MMRILHDLDTRDVTLTSSPAPVSTLPLANLLKARRGYFTRWTTTTFTLSGTYPNGKVVDGLTLLGHTCSNGATWRVRLWADLARTQLVYDSGTVRMIPIYGWGEMSWGIDAVGASPSDGWPLRFALCLTGSTVAIRAFDIDIVDTANTAGYVDIGRLMVGMSFTPSHHGDGATLAWQDDGKQIRTRGGSLETVSSTVPYRRAELPYSSLPETDRAALTEIARRIGTREDFLLITWDGATETTLQRDGAIHGKFVQPPKALHRALNAYDLSNLIVEEC